MIIFAEFLAERSFLFVKSFLFKKSPRLYERI